MRTLPSEKIAQTQAVPGVAGRAISAADKMAGPGQSGRSVISRSKGRDETAAMKWPENSPARALLDGLTE